MSLDSKYLDCENTFDDFVEISCGSVGCDGKLDLSAANALIDSKKFIELAEHLFLTPDSMPPLYILKYACSVLRSDSCCIYQSIDDGGLVVTASLGSPPIGYVLKPGEGDDYIFCSI